MDRLLTETHGSLAEIKTEVCVWKIYATESLEEARFAVFSDLLSNILS